jgi:hypothetical protein
MRAFSGLYKRRSFRDPGVEGPLNPKAGAFASKINREG